MIQVHLSPDAITSLKAFGNTIITASGEEWIYFPYWMKQTDKDKIELVSFEHLPPEVVSLIRREKTPEEYDAISVKREIKFNLPE
jgi:hypothetical protein